MDGCTWIAPVAQAVQPTTDADGAAKTAIFAIVSHIRGFPGLVLRDARSTNRISVLQSTLGGAEGVGALVRVRTLPNGVENPGQQAERATRTASASRGSDRQADMPSLRQKADAR